ncbi:DeoR/GlpR family DNA-binding transcription regulator [Tropicimonas marinistellae]|uniref:DeoR/GlpR family DNA-binding transcription regulator n=1 Tax=Tropicimonas marinistellae TaxID=1739787 RepID=UPI000836EC15|nr:DeoR/GlpR family DNA-binding transcription regulator [Tropicimonas marinistellae]
MGDKSESLTHVRKTPRKAERQEQILLELKLRPHVRIVEMAERFGVSPETVRRDMDRLSKEGLIARAHGGATVATRHYPDFDQRSRDRQEEREAIGRRAAALVMPGDTVMIDSGSTTLQLARFLAVEATPCTVITNSLAVAMTLGQADAAEVILCPGDYQPSEAAVIGTDTVAFLLAHSVDRCLIGASGLTADGFHETVRGFAAIKRAMLERSRAAHLLIDSGKFGRSGLAQVAGVERLTSLVVDRRPDGPLGAALAAGEVDVLLAARQERQT